MKRAELPLKIYSVTDGREIYFDIKNSLFCFAHNTESNISCAWYFDRMTTADKMSSFLSELTVEHGFSANKSVIKLIGDTKVYGDSLAHFNKLQLKIEKYVERNHKFEVMYLSQENRIRLAAESVKAPTGPLKVLIVDDSKTIRQILERLFSSDPSLQVVASLEDPREVARAIETYKPDVMTLDIHMPHLDGIMVLKQVLPKFPIPTVMISSISLEEGPMVLNALEAGAVDYIQKPTFDQIASMRETIIEKVKTAARAQVKIGKKNQMRVKGLNLDHSVIDIIAIGSSTGGTEALKDVLTRLPENIPPILIVQHIPPVFSKAFADRMNDLCSFEVKEAEMGDEVRRNRVLIAPGGIHMKLKKVGAALRIELEDSEPVNRFKPSVDVMFRSVAQLMPKSTLGLILTGMGSDGAKGLLELREKGALTIGQDEPSCVVYGMPKAAFEVGAVQHVVSLDKIPEKIMALMSTQREGKAS